LTIRTALGSQLPPLASTLTSHYFTHWTLMSFSSNHHINCQWVVCSLSYSSWSFVRL